LDYLNPHLRLGLIERQQLQVVWVDQPVGSASSIRFIH
jgi:hypothetical protein